MRIRIVTVNVAGRRRGLGHREDGFVLHDDAPSVPGLRPPMAIEAPGLRRTEELAGSSQPRIITEAPDLAIHGTL
jgi:hypothetical protein